MKALDELDEEEVSLSVVIYKCIRIAYTLDDPKAVYSFKLENSNYESKSYNRKIKYEFVEAVLRKYDDYELAKSWQREIIEGYLERRSIRALDSDYTILKETMIKGISISEIESEINNMKLSLEKNVISEGLAPLDLYYAQERKEKLDLILTFQIGEAKRIIAKVRNYLYSYLVDVEGRGFQDGIREGMKKKMNKKVFVIHGHNEAKRRELVDILKNDFFLEPIVLEEQPSRGSSTIIDKFEFYAKQCSYAIALFTPDDVVIKDEQEYLQARPNVLYELGWFSSYLSRQRVLLILQEGKNMTLFSDFDGVIQLRFKENIQEVYRNLKQELEFVEMIDS